MNKINKLLDEVFVEMEITTLYEMCCQLQEVMEDSNILFEANGNTNREKVVEKMKDKDNWIVNDYRNFLKSLNKSQFQTFLTPYTIDELKQGNIKTYKLRGYNIGFALKHNPNNTYVEIISVHNNSNVKGISEQLLNVAKSFGGNSLDHFDGKLSDIYQRNGFEEYDRWKWCDEYAPKGWDYEKYGRPDVIFRRLKETI